MSDTTSQETTTQPQAQTIVIQNQNSFPVAGFLSIMFGIVGIFMFGLIFAPLSFISAIIGFAKKQFVTSIFGLIISIVAAITSPSILAILAGIGIALFK